MKKITTIMLVLLMAGCAAPAQNAEHPDQTAVSTITHSIGEAAVKGVAKAVAKNKHEAAGKEFHAKSESKVEKFKDRLQENAVEAAKHIDRVVGGGGGN